MEQMSEIQRYVQIMQNIKVRSETIQKLIHKNITTSNTQLDIEFICLQFRNILEDIALASLSPNKKVYIENQVNIQHVTNIRSLFHNLETINKNFYPIPMTEHPPIREGDKAHFKRLEFGYLTKDEYRRVYKRCGALLHTNNPFTPKPDFEKLISEFTEWRVLITRLLEKHLTILIDNKTIWLVRMTVGENKEVQTVVAGIEDSAEEWTEIE